MAKGTAKVEWNSKAIIELMRQVTTEQEMTTAKRIWANAIRNVPIGKYGRYRYMKRRDPLIRRGSKRKHGIKKDWMRRSAGTLMKSIKRVSSKYKEGGQLVWTGNERLAYYAHFVEFGTVFMERRRGYKFLRSALNKERNSFLREVQAKVNG